MSKNKITDCERNFIEHLLSFKNTKDKRHKVITVAGLKFKIKRKKYIQLLNSNEKIYPTEYKSIKEDIIDIDAIKKYIDNPNIKIISFDIFDTLLIRPVIDPTDIFYLVDLKLKKTHNIDFLKYRLSAEAEMQNIYANIDDIYNFIQHKYRLDDNTTYLMKQEELNCEKQLLSRREDVFSLYKYALAKGKEVIVISDMYLQKSFLQDILNKNGYNNISNIYVSNEFDARKDTGELYNVVLKEEQISPKEILHIGDNFKSDYAKAIEENITAIYFPSIKNIVFRDHIIYNYIWENFDNDPIFKIILGFTINEYFKNINEISDYPSVFVDFEALIKLWLAPFVFATSIAIANNEEIQHNYSKIFFASRDGNLPLIGYNLLCKKLKGKRLPAEYIYAGRRAYIPALEKDFISYANNRTYKKGYTLNHLLHTVLLEENIKKKLQTSITSQNLNLELSKNRNKLVDILKPYKNILKNYWTSSNNNIKKYYTQFITNSKHEIVFDCGYSGSISKALSTIMQKPVDKIYLWQDSTNNIKLDKSYGTKTYLLGGDISHVYPCHLIYEELFSPLEGGCIGFDCKGSPILEKLNCNTYMQREYAIIQNKIKLFINNLSNLLKPYLEYITIDNISNYNKILEFALTKSPYCESALFKHIIFPDNVFEPESLNLQCKIEGVVKYKTPFSQTGFENPKNIVMPPNILLNSSYKIGIHCHLYNIDLSQEIIQYLKDFPQKFDLYLTICDITKKQLLENLFDRNIVANLDKLTIVVTPNRGRDVSPWLIEMNKFQYEYDLFCHIHSKKTIQWAYGNSWRKYLYNNLIDKNAFTNICNIFYTNPRLGILYPNVYLNLKNLCIQCNVKQIGEFGEERIINSLLKKMKFENYSRADMFFSEGTMFWYRPMALKPLFDLSLRYEDFPNEPIGVGGTIAHAIERLPGFVALNNNYENKIYNYTMKDY